MPAVLYVVIVLCIGIGAIIVGIVITAMLNPRQRSEDPPDE